MLLKAIKTATDGLLDLIYPPVCLVCRRDCDDGPLCSQCVESFQRIGPPYCDRCGEPISRGSIVCKRCERHAGPAYDWSHAPYQYDGAVLRAVHRFKYDGRSALAEPLGILLAKSVGECPQFIDPNRDAALPAFNLVIPVPLHPSRERARGFNQAQKLAAVVCRECGLELNSNAVRRTKRTRTQTAMTQEMRAANIRGAFRVVSPQAVDGKSVLVVDDVLTSTSTVREVSRVIAQAGASRVCVLALARSV